MLTPEAWEQRKSGIGGSDAAAVMGLSRWRGPVDVWADKVGLTPYPEPSLRQWIGGQLEPLIATMFTARTGIKVRRAAGMYRSKAHPYMLGNVDYVGLECKTSYSAEGWGAADTPVTPDEWEGVIPIDYLIQTQHYLSVTGWRKMHVAVLIGHDDFRTYDVAPVPQLIEPMVKAEQEFWDQYVVPGVPPPLDASEGARAYLRTHFPRAMGTLRTATPEETLLLDEIRRADEAVKLATADAEALRARLRGAIGADLGIKAPGVTVTYLNVERKPVTDWKLVAESYKHVLDIIATPEQLADLSTVVGLYTSTPESYRRLNFSRKNGG